MKTFPDLWIMGPILGNMDRLMNHIVLSRLKFSVLNYHKHHEPPPNPTPAFLAHHKYYHHLYSSSNDLGSFFIDASLYLASILIELLKKQKQKKNPPILFYSLTTCISCSSGRKKLIPLHLWWGTCDWEKDGCREGISKHWEQCRSNKTQEGVIFRLHLWCRYSHVNKYRDVIWAFAKYRALYPWHLI